MVKVLRGSRSCNSTVRPNCFNKYTRQLSPSTMKRSQTKFVLHKDPLIKVRERILEFGNNKERSKQTGGVLNLLLSMSIPVLLSIP